MILGQLTLTEWELNMLAQAYARERKRLMAAARTATAPCDREALKGQRAALEAAARKLGLDDLALGLGPTE